MTDAIYRPDSPAGDLIDDLVADIIDSANRHVGVARDSIERLTSYPALAERYGDFNLAIDFGGQGGRMLRRDIHRALRDKGMTLRAIAAETGVPKSTVADDLASLSETGHDDADELSETGHEDDSHDLPDPTPPGPYWSTLGEVVKPLRGLTDLPPTDVAASVPSRRRAGTAKTLRRLGTYLGAIALELEGME